MSRDLFWLTVEQFARIEPHLPADTRGKPRVDDRRVISGIVNVLKSGGRWVDAHHPRMVRGKPSVHPLVCEGRLDEHLSALARDGGPPAQVLLDSSAVKA